MTPIQMHGDGMEVDVKDDMMISYWKPSWVERIKILLGKPVRLCVIGSIHPSVGIDA